MIKIIARWDTCGQSDLELDIEEMTDGEIMSMSASFAEELVMDRNTVLKEAGILDEHYTQLSEPLWPTREYFLYYAYHPSSAYYTHDFNVRYEDGDPVFTADVRRHEGGSFPAFWSEVIIFRLL